VQHFIFNFFLTVNEKELMHRVSSFDYMKLISIFVQSQDCPMMRT